MKWISNMGIRKISFKIFLLVLIMWAGAYGALAQSMLKVRTADSRRINVMLDGRYFNKTGTSVTIGDLPYGRHKLRIFSTMQGRRGRPYEEIIFEGKVRTEPGMITMFVYDPASDGVDVQEQDMNAYLNEHPIPNAGAEQNNNADNSNYGNENNTSNYNDNSSAPVASPVQESQSSLTASRMDELKSKVDALKTDTEKMNGLKDGLKSETLTTKQVGDIMDWLGFESTKVDFAKWAYSKTTDPDYYTDLESKFTYKNYQDELDGFIKGKK